MYSTGKSDIDKKYKNMLDRKNIKYLR